MTYICHLFEASIHIWILRLYCLVKNKAIFIYKWYKKYICDIKAKCVQTCLHQSMLSFPLLQVKPQRNCWKILSYFLYWWWVNFFFNFFYFWTLYVTLWIRIQDAPCLHEPHAMMIDWVQRCFSLSTQLYASLKALLLQI